MVVACAESSALYVMLVRMQIMKRVEAILYAATAEEGRQILLDTQAEFGEGV